MATRRWLGAAADVYDLWTATVGGTWAQGDTVTVTINNKSVVGTVGSTTTTTQVALLVKNMINSATSSLGTAESFAPTGGGQTIGEFTEITATSSSGTVYLTANTAGVPITISVDKSSTSGTFTITNTTPATGKSFWNNVDNWSGNTVPVDNDTVVFDSGSTSLKYNLSAAIQPAKVIRTRGYTGQIGLPRVNEDNASYPYDEYRGQYLTFDDNSATCTYDLHTDDGNGGGLTKIDAGAGQSIFNVYATVQRSITGVPSILLQGSHSSNVLNAPQGDVGVAYYPDESATLATVRVGDTDSSQASVVLGSGVTLTSATITLSGGSLVVQSAFGSGTLTQTAGTCSVLGTGACGTVNVDGGEFRDRTSGTTATLRVSDGGFYNRSQDLRAKTITNAVQLYKGARFYDPNATITASGGYVFNRCNVEEVEFDVGVNRTVTVS